MLALQTKRRRGAVAIETALLFPLLVLLIFGMIEFGLLLYNRQVLTNASREGARYGIVMCSPLDPDSCKTGTDIHDDAVKPYCEDRLFTFGPRAESVSTVTIGPPGTEGAPCMGSYCCQAGSTFGYDLEVTVNYRYSFLVLTNFGFGPIDLVARTVMKCE